MVIVSIIIMFGIIVEMVGGVCIYIRGMVIYLLCCEKCMNMCGVGFVLSCNCVLDGKWCVSCCINFVDLFDVEDVLFEGGLLVLVMRLGSFICRWLFIVVWKVCNWNVI